MKKIASGLLVMAMLATSLAIAPKKAFAATFGITSAGTTTYPNAGFIETDVLTAEAGEDGAALNFIDVANGFGYIGADVAPGKLIKYNLSTMARVGVLTFNAGENYPYSAVVHDGFAYVGLWTGTVVKVNLTTFTRVSSLALSGQLTGAVVDSSTGKGYFATTDTPAKIHKVDLATFTLDSTLTFNAGEDSIWSDPIIDSSTGMLYAAAYTSPTKILKVNLATFTRVGALTLNSGENGVYGIADDTTNGMLYVATLTNPAILVKIQKSDFTRVAALTLTGVNGAGKNSVSVDPSGSFVYVMEGNSGKKLSKISTASFTSLGTVSGTPSGFYDGDEYDLSGGFGYFATYAAPAQISKIALSQKGLIKGTKLTLSSTTVPTSISFYSHTNVGNLRLGIYDSTKTLVWESGSVANTGNGDWVTVNISDGTPTTLSLPAGTYWLAYQTNTMTSVPSYTAGTSGDGFYKVQSYGAFAASITGETSTSETWSMYLTGTASSSGPRTVIIPAIQTPEAGFKTTLVNGIDGTTTNSHIAELQFNDGGDVYAVKISTDPDFSNYYYGYYRSTFSYDFCRPWYSQSGNWHNGCPDGEYTLYVKLYTYFGVEGTPEPLKIIYKRQ